MALFTIVILLWVAFFSYRYVIAGAKKANCDSSEKEKRFSKRICIFAIAFGVLIWITTFILVKFVY